MTRVLAFEHHYPVPPDRLFALVTDLDTLEAVTKPWVQFHHLPSGPVHEGQVIDVALSLFGLFPVRPYQMRVMKCDPVARVMRSEEDGMGIHKLTHELHVQAEDTGAVLTDRIEIDAGWMTPFVAIWAHIIYRRRHPIRLRLLGITPPGAAGP
ncbi:SRPBCC family protein [Falsiphaeobacter marinintestinus]|uniref:SRPBCC family protein n=1 Tax=Falsiphaeobacter marinintestinus TaxID=1492905 RepID=UPI0011B40D76|nr:SRPBCC family protein [Phaeobacter marinintestinus]